jgi:hypothetical protein
MPLLIVPKLRAPAQQCGFRICKLQFYQTAFNGLSVTENFRNFRGTGQDLFQDLDDLGFIYMPFFTKESAFHCSISGEDDASILIAAFFFDSENLDKKLPLHNVQTHERTRKDPSGRVWANVARIGGSLRGLPPGSDPKRFVGGAAPIIGYDCRNANKDEAELHQGPRSIPLHQRPTMPP